MLKRLALALLLVVLAGASSAQQTTRVVGPSGLPLPRFASLASGEVNVRTGPSKDYPIRWVYTRPGLPVRIVEEYDTWRRVQDPDGEEGWTHSSLLTTKRTVMVLGNGVQTLHRAASADARVVLRAEPGVIGDLVECEGDWCRVEIAGDRGWIERSSLFGVLPDD
ncbi:MAG: SH3 domain-containing protein [Geminicoccaceae bacterium]